MKETKIANRYAKALFDLALEKELLDHVKTDMELVVSVCQQNKDFTMMLKSPIIFTDKKEAILKEIFENQIQQMSYFFLLIITNKKREAVIESIAQQFIVIYKEYKNITEAQLSTAVEIDQQLKAQLVALLKEQTKGEIELDTKVEKDLIGGFVLNYDNKQYDSSIQKQIKKLKQDFDQNLYIREF
jgi:F-type H+-transporting ATPase subunit delta